MKKHCVISEKVEKQIKDVLERIKTTDVKGNSGFAPDKKTIEDVFKTPACNTQDIRMQLTLIDSMYSTQMSRRYYALEDLAKALWAVCEEDYEQLKKMFRQLAVDHDVSKFNYTDPDTQEKCNLWSNSYGIGKDGSDKGVAISLISKYAYFATGYEFPIYDSIVCEMLQLIWVDSKVKKRNNESGDVTIQRFLKNISDLREKYNVSFDHLDRLLWFVGKIIRGNLSLVLTRSEYLELLDYMSKANMNKFEIAKVDINKLNFIQDDLVKAFFELAHTLVTR